MRGFPWCRSLTTISKPGVRLCESSRKHRMLLLRSRVSQAGRPPIFCAVTMRQWIRECVETFGPERCMFGSNFHVERLFVTLPKLFRTYRRAVEDYTLAEQDAMFAGTAERVYRI